ncbi:hypothetical protein [Xanthobacter oligotrophicus]|uniref:hypothetical protein n=1 Tax=Xanthobacter oligotrophicus TaxID=2607286 RepID=UPI0011F23419|nr:hypothetical protein [Xanthobacter oligotrophicus]MCG5235797.1 hypothetical protein [Xanthobacter oligotrophicus]
MTNTTFRRRVAPWCALALIALAASPALALDPVPKGYREKQRHQFRDVQLGLTHPATDGRSKPTGNAPTAPVQPKPAPETGTGK